MMPHHVIFNNPQIMGLSRDLLSLGGYFLLLSAVIQAEDAFVYYYDEQNSSSLSAKVK